MEKIYIILAYNYDGFLGVQENLFFVSEYGAQKYIDNVLKAVESFADTTFEVEGLNVFN